MTGGGLAVSTVAGALDEPAVGAGFSIQLASAVDEFGWLFTDQRFFDYTIELFNGATSLGSSNEYYGEWFPSQNVRGGSPFDRIEITFPTQTTPFMGNPAVPIGGVGIDMFSFGTGPGPAPLTPGCVETFYDGRFGLFAGDAMFMDITVNTPVSIDMMIANMLPLAVGSPVNVEIYTTPVSRSGNETDITNWTLAAFGDGTTLSAGFSGRTEIPLTSPLNLTAGTFGLAIVAVDAGFLWTPGNGTNETHTSGDGNITISNGAYMDQPFTANTITQPAVFNGRLCSSGPANGIGSPFCSPNPNSTGVAGQIQAFGSDTVAANNVTLQVNNIPGFQFGIFVVSSTAGASVTVNEGILCLSGEIGRYQQPGQIYQANASGTASFMIDLAAIPQPMSLETTAIGDTWFFQAWHRDFVNGDPGQGNTSNFTNGVEITFQ